MLPDLTKMPHRVAVPVERSARLIFFSRSGRVRSFFKVRKDILAWLDCNVGKDGYVYHQDYNEQVSIKFFFVSKEKAALFKLFWY